MADQDSDSGPKIVPADPPGGDNSNFPAKAAAFGARNTLGALPVGAAVRAVGRMFGGPKPDDIAD
jgi:hypothetical protein